MEKIQIDIAEAKRLHITGQAMKLHGRFSSGLLKAAVYGANDGIVTTFAVVAGVAGAGLSPAVVLILGIGNMVADGLSMGIGDYLGERSERRHMKHQYDIEHWEVMNIPEEEEKELDKYLSEKGVHSVTDRKSLVHTIVKYPKLWSTLGFIEEMGVVPEFEGAQWKSGLVTFLAFVAAGSMPLLPYFLQFLGVDLAVRQMFGLSVAATSVALFFVGSMRTFITKGQWWWNGLEMLGIGSLAAIAAYGLGAFVEQMIR